MKKFVVSESTRTNMHRHATIEAVDAQEARRKFAELQLTWDTENSTTEVDVRETMGSQMLGDDMGMAVPSRLGAVRGY